MLNCRRKMKSLLRLLMLVTAAIVLGLATMFNGLPPCLLRHRYVTELKMRNEGSSSCPNQFTSLYLENIDPQISEEMLIQMFSGFGEIIRLVLAKDFKGESRGFAFIEFKTTASAEQAVKHMNGTLIGQKILFIERTPKVDEGQDIE